MSTYLEQLHSEVTKLGKIKAAEVSYMEDGSVVIDFEKYPEWLDWMANE